MTRRLINTIGGFCEAYHPYGLEDSDYCFRAALSGFKNYYIPGLKSEHIGELGGQAKEQSFFSNLGLHRWRAHNFYKIGLYEPLPMPKEELT